MVNYRKYGKRKGGELLEYSRETGVVQLSLDELCLLTTGRSPVGNTPDAAFYARQPLFFPADHTANAEVFAEIEHGGVAFRLYGKVACVFCEGGRWTADAVRLTPEGELSRAPSRELSTYAKLSSLLVCLEKKCDKAGYRVVRVGEKDGAVSVSAKKTCLASLLSFGESLLSYIMPRVRELVRRESRVRPSAKDIPFPYEEIREGQLQMIRRAMSVIKRGEKLFACAPTGIGKTMSALYPAVRAFGDGLCDKIFYLTAKSSTAAEAYHAGKRLYDAGAHLRVIVLTAKEQMCPKREYTGGHCDPRACGCLRHYEAQSREAIAELLASHNGFGASLIGKVAEKYGICPYELSLDLSEYCDIIICDYNYLFDPTVHLRRYFDEERFGKYVFLIDEAHNLVDRARAMYSITLSRRRVLELLEALPAEKKELRRAVVRVLVCFDRARARCRGQIQEITGGVQTGYDIGRDRVEGLDAAIQALSGTLFVWLRKNRNDELYELLNEYHRELSKYIAISEHYDEKFITYIEVLGDEVRVSLTCIDPSDVVADGLEKGRASILFSATLTPIHYFCDLLGGDRHTAILEPPSPYERENLCVAAVDSISTRYEDRDKNARRVATYIAAAVSPKAGNYMVYFSSYGYLEKVHAAFCKKYPGVCTVVQKKGMRMWEKEEFLASFPADSGKMRIGFCVLGGLFSEGVDLPGSRLIGSIIVGVGLPGFSSERNIMRDYFENRYENGFDYAYTYPGMNHVLQAAGRVIRREDDKGIVVLIDDRYGTPVYQKLFPPHWRHLQYAGNPASLAEITRKFWEK